MGDDGVVGAVAAVGVKSHHQVEVSLVRIRLAFLAHVIGSSLAEVKSTHGDLGHLLPVQIHPGTTPSYNTEILIFYPCASG